MKQLSKTELLDVNGGESWWEKLWYGIGYTLSKKQYEATCPGGRVVENPNGSYPAAICVKN